MSENGIEGLRLGGPVSHAVLSFDGTKLAVSQRDIRTIEAAQDMVARDPPEGGVGWISAFGRLVPVYALSRELVPLSVAPPARRLCVVLGQEGGTFAMLC